jgi:hypothetical protein
MRVGRFQVMALLQAARAVVLGLPVDSAKSWGLNRAIFYAAAKKGYIGARGLPVQPPRKKPALKQYEAEKIAREMKIYHLGDEMAYIVGDESNLQFVIGDQIQTPQDFDRQIKRRFGENFEKAWQEAIRICQNAGKGVLFSQRYFFESVYKPRRDELSQKWSKLT